MSNTMNRDTTALRQPTTLRNRPAVSRVVRRVTDLFALWRLRHRSRRELALLAPSRLWDLGLDKSQAEMEACKPFWRP